MFELKGIYTPIATVFENDEISYKHMDTNLDFGLGSKLEGIVVLGSNGEFVSLTEAEKIEMVRFCCKKAKGKKKIVVGVGSNCLKETLNLCNVAAECGADAVLAVTPYYYKGGMTDAVLKAYFTDLANKSPLPVVLYNMPGNTGVNTSAALLSALSEHPNIIGVKDTGGSIAQISETLRDASDTFSVFAGNWAFFLPSLHMGAKGATLALGNILPNECVELMELFAIGKYEEARQLHMRLMAVNAAVTAKFGVSGLKAAMDAIGLYGGVPRSPLLPATEETKKAVREILTNAGIKLK